MTAQPDNAALIAQALEDAKYIGSFYDEAKWWPIADRISALAAALAAAEKENKRISEQLTQSRGFEARRAADALVAEERAQAARAAHLLADDAWRTAAKAKLAAEAQVRELRDALERIADPQRVTGHTLTELQLPSEIARAVLARSAGAE